MPSSTPVMGLPYPLGTDPVADGDDAIKALAERIEHRYARGMIDRKVITTTTPAIGTVLTDVAGLNITATLFAGRWYRLSTRGLVQMQTAAGRVSVVLNGDGATLNDWVEDIVANNYAPFNLQHEFQATAGAHTYKVQGLTTAGTTIVFAASTRNMTHILEDIGPVTP